MKKQELKTSKTTIPTELIIAEKCRRSFYFFVQQFWEINTPAIPVWGKHVKVLCDHAQKVALRVINKENSLGDELVNVPPGTSKSTIYSVMLNAWMWTIAPHIKMISASYSDAVSLELSTKTRNIVVCDKYKLFFPNVILKKDQANKSNFQTTKNGARFTTSTGASITGFHAHIIICDDPQNPELANSEKERARTNDFVSATLSTRKEEPKKAVTMIVVQQRLHSLDVSGFLLAAGGINHICLPSELTDTIRPVELAEIYTDGLLDPVRMDRAELAKNLRRLGSRGYNTQMLQNPTGEKDAILKEDWIKIIGPDKFKQITGDKPYSVDFYIDTAYTENTKNDPSAMLACTKIEQILYILKSKSVWLEMPEFLVELESFVKQNGYTNQSRIKVEPKATGKSVVQMLKRTSLNISETPAPSKSKIERLNAIAPSAEAGKIVFVEGYWNSGLMSQTTTNYPPHDDERDCLTMAAEEKLILKHNSGKYNIGFSK